ncbi:G-type lectin S-receptor-like serine/threonine-protein kinase At5g35370 [Lactuca sativa]|uniref:Receptor-like serine/threonine-protein kinase n=1 Tax=Lactuca sativa TaxID=4236 RepID=A0A9R1XIM5_LACSA|nr:G-type lectin S-receptor-like serine/threonine-protein kinase At5g35370 [Lactuca sativa]KAJ0209207.1 hypothetical protein LSAT_V11C400161610 [Lactuca sativa]
MAATIATFLLLFLFLSTSYSATTYTGSISSSSNFTASNFHYVDQNGDFLRSVNRTYTAAMFNSQPKSPSFYLLIYHSDSRNVVWVANRNKPISNSGQLLLSFTGITIYDDSGIPVWSTPTFNSTVASLQLLDSGNLLLIDRFNKTLWQSFDYPTDTIVSGQRFPVGGSLIASNDDADFSEGGYTFTVTTGDGLLRWQNLTYYRLLMDSKSVINSNQPISYLMVNGSGFYLFGGQGSEVVVQVLITTAAVNSDYRILKLTNAGYLNVMRYTNRNWVTDFTTPEESCRAPFSCGKLGLCSPGGCSCPPGFRGDRNANPGCSPSDNSLLLPESCGGNGTRLRSNSSEKYVYIPLGDGMKYYPIDFTNPTRKGVNLSTCENLCSSNCSCLAIFHGNPSGSCYLLQNHLGSFLSSSANGNDDTLGFIKAISLSQNHNSNSSSDFPVVALILLPGSGVLLISIFAIWMRIRSRNNATNSHSKKLNDNFGSEDLELFSIAGLPIRFDHEDLVEATKDFSTQIGSGGFGTVYKGVLRDKTVVAVKKITSLGAQGKKEFGTEIAIIGNIHHVNLVKLKGFCAHGRERFLVYEYMSRGSLDRTIFGTGPPLEWQERFEIAVGTARGLAYLHNGCEHKIIHCDVKPENILLSDGMQVKISDFGLSKLLSPEQSGLFTTMRGTRGYLAPEWLTNAAISDKTDVYSYGMVLLELIQGRKNCVQAPSHSSRNPTSSTDGQSSRSSGSRNHSQAQGRARARAFYFPLHALEMHEEGRYLDLVDPRLAGRVTRAEAEKLVKVALCCLHEDPSVRLTMANVVGMLEGVLPVGEPRLDSLNFLRFYGQRFTEPSMAGTGEEVEVGGGFMVTTNYSSSPSMSLNSFSYMSSQQVSGPR